MIQDLFDKNVITATSTAGYAEHVLYPEEAALVREAVPKRRAEFAAGRCLAREALSQLGVVDFPILRGPGREPIWPDGITGSITHCVGFCGVAVARMDRTMAIGLDVESSAPLDQELVPMICIAKEQANMHRTSEMAPGLTAKLIFSAKESVYKCVYMSTGISLDFHDCEIELSHKTRTFSPIFDAAGESELSLTGQFSGRWTLDQSLLATGLTFRKTDA
ncbi:MAG: 4'-phosphopantetheinyl transferase family protein [Planctomycetota bacterium]